MLLQRKEYKMEDLEKLVVPTIEFVSVTMLDGLSSTKCQGGDGNNTDISSDLGYGEENIPDY